MCTPGYIWGKRIETAYKNRASRKGETFKERKRARVSCTVCRVTVVASSLKGHTEMQNDRIAPHMREVEIGGGGGIYLCDPPPWVLKMVSCPVTGYTAAAHIAGRPRENFMDRNFLSRIEVVKEGREPIPCYKLCGMNMSEGRLTKHQHMQQSEQSTQMRWRRRDITITRRYA